MLWRARPATREIPQVAFSPDGTKLGIAPGGEGSRSGRGANLTDENRDAIVLDTADGRTLFKLASAPGKWSLIKSISFRADGRRILTASGLTDAATDIVREWDAATGAHVADHDVGFVKLNPGKTGIDASGVTYDPSGRNEYAVVCNMSGISQIRSADGAEYKWSLTRHDQGLPNAFWAGYSRDGRFLVTHKHTSLAVWDRKRDWTEPSRFTTPLRRCFKLEDLPSFKQVA